MKNSAIEWTHHTFNPWIGCTKVSPGCKNCYAAALDNRWGHDRWGAGKPRERTSDANWRHPIAWNKEAIAAGERRRVFCASLADVFDIAIDPMWKLELFNLIRITPGLDWLLLTKRPEHIRSELARAVGAYGTGATGPSGLDAAAWTAQWATGHPPSNVWLGTTVEDQQRADERIPRLLEAPAVVHFLSCEPLLERVDLLYGKYNRNGHFWKECPTCRGTMSVPVDGGGKPCPTCLKNQGVVNAGIDWVIGGGESGGGARPMNPDWARSLRDQCAAAGVAFLFKQWGDFDAKGKRVGKKVAGRLLDKVQHDGYPAPRLVAA